MAGTGGKRAGAGRKPGVSAKKMIEAALRAQGFKSDQLWQSAVKIACDDGHKQQSNMIQALLKSIDAEVKSDTEITIKWKV